MNTLQNSMKIGFVRAFIELKQNLPLIFNFIFFPSIALFVMFMLRGVAVGETNISLGLYAIPGIIAMNVLFTGLMGIASALMMEREDGTLMRVRAVPHGTLGYFIGKIASQFMLTILTFGVVFVVALFLFDGLFENLSRGILVLVWLLPLGIMAMLPLGVAMGALLRHPRQLSLISLVLMGMTVVSGVFYPVALQSDTAQTLGQVFPLYWLGHGLRSAMLPESTVALEMGGTWSLGTAVIVLGIWAVATTTLALFALKKISPHAPGSTSNGRRIRTRARVAQAR